MQSCQILIVSAVKICKQCLQTALAFVGRISQGLSPWTPPGPLGFLLAPIPVMKCLCDAYSGLITNFYRLINYYLFISVIFLLNKNHYINRIIV